MKYRCSSLLASSLFGAVQVFGGQSRLVVTRPVPAGDCVARLLQHSRRHGPPAATEISFFRCRTSPTRRRPACLMKISPNDEVSLFWKLPAIRRPATSVPMGIRQAPSGDFYVADCQNWMSAEELAVAPRRMNDGKPAGVEMVAEDLNIANGVAIHDGPVYMTDSAVGKTDGRSRP